MDLKMFVDVNGHRIELRLDKIKKYTRYSLYQVSKVVDGVKVPVYQECFSDFDVKRLTNGEATYSLDVEDIDENVDLLGLLD